MFKFFHKFKFKTIHIGNCYIQWTDTGTTSEAAILFQENGFGFRRLRTEGSLYPCDIKTHPYYLKLGVPWREKCLEPKWEDHINSLSPLYDPAFKPKYKKHGDNVIKITDFKK